MKITAYSLVAYVAGCTLAALSPSTLGAESPGIFMSVVTNMVRITNRVIVTNYVVTTNITLTTNYYNAQGQLLTPVMPPVSPAPSAAAASTPTARRLIAPDPAVVRASRVEAVRQLLSQGVGVASNTLSKSGAFTSNPAYQIQIPEGVTVFDRKKAQTLSTAMNTAAEKAVPAATAVLQKSIAELNPPDPAQILQGGSDAVTRFLLKEQGTTLTNQVLAIVQQTAAEARVPEAYNAVMLRGGGLLGAVLGSGSGIDINAHIAGGVMKAILASVSAQEQLLRSDPSARKTKELQEALAR